MVLKCISFILIFEEIETTALFRFDTVKIHIDLSSVVRELWLFYLSTIATYTLMKFWPAEILNHNYISYTLTFHMHKSKSLAVVEAEN